MSFETKGGDPRYMYIVWEIPFMQQGTYYGHEHLCKPQNLGIQLTTVGSDFLHSYHENVFYSHPCSQ